MRERGRETILMIAECKQRGNKNPSSLTTSKFFAWNTQKKFSFCPKIISLFSTMYHYNKTTLISNIMCDENWFFSYCVRNDFEIKIVYTAVSITFLKNKKNAFLFFIFASFFGKLICMSFYVHVEKSIRYEEHSNDTNNIEKKATSIDYNEVTLIYRKNNNNSDLCQSLAEKKKTKKEIEKLFNMSIIKKVSATVCYVFVFAILMGIFDGESTYSLYRKIAFFSL